MTHWLRFRELLSRVKEINGTVSRKWKANSSPVSKSKMYPSNQSEQSFLKTAGPQRKPFSSFSLSQKLQYEKDMVVQSSLRWKEAMTNISELSCSQYPADIKDVVCMYCCPISIPTQLRKTIFTPCIHTSAQPLSDSSNDLTLG